jgi:hypothetical protein
MRASFLFASALFLLSTGCDPPRPPPLELRVTAASDEGMRLAGLAVKIDDRVVGRTDARGELHLGLPQSDEGKRVRVSVQTPDGFRALTDARLIALERMTTRGGGTLPLELHARFASTVRHYVVLVDVGRPNLPIEVFGVQQAVTNSAGVAMFMTPGAPSDALEVRVTNGGRTDLTPAYLAQTFNLQDRADVFMLRGEFTAVPAKKRPAPRPHRPQRL